jgi:glycosyltransferase involved in cell wall biosynthesis
MKKVKVAHIATIDVSLRTLLLNQMRSLQEAGYEVVGISSPGPYVAEIRAAGIRHIPVPMTRRVTPFRDLLSLYQLYRVLRGERFTIVHVHTMKPILLGQLAARLAGVPIVLSTIHGFYFHDHMRPAKRRFFIMLEKWAAMFSDLMLSQNSEDIQTAVRERICPAEKIKHLGNGIDVGRFHRARLNRQVLERKRGDLGLREGSVVGFVGRLVAEKGILELLSAARTVLQRIPSTQFLIIGPIDHEKADALTPEIARAYGVEDACVFTGARDDIQDLYALMDILVLPSHREGFPRAPMEASAMGVPCVVTNIRGCRETVEQGRNGVLVPLGDVPALAAAIVDLLARPEQARHMGDEGRRMAIERFDEQRVFEKVRAEYAGLLATKGLVASKMVSETGSLA